jgi:hypothetical protein
LNYGYQQRDHEVVDYGLVRLEGTTDLYVRGPWASEQESTSYFVCAGAAQTFGCFCEAPYPALLAQRLNVPVLNLGFAGVGPRFFLINESLLHHISQACFAVVQVMSGRSEDNRLFSSGGREFLTRVADGAELGAEPAYAKLLETADVATVREILSETRSNWIESYQRLLASISCPTVLFWFSQRPPEYEERLSGVHELFGGFPQLVNRAMVEAVRPFADSYVECITSRGMPQQLVNRFTGESVTIVGRADLGARRLVENTYYPSPEMHEDAAIALDAVCSGERFAGRVGSRS